MSTVVVWVLVMNIGSLTGGGSGPAVIDNIASEQECERVAGVIHNAGQIPFFKGLKCIRVEKAKP